MKISLEWLSDFVDLIETDPTKIADALTLSTAEVEEVIMQGELIKDCIVGKVLTVKKHPDADKLLLVTVDTGKGEVPVVCGGTNVQEGMLVAFAPVGATVKWHGGELMTLAPVKIRGEKSEGMICAAEELGLEDMFPAAEEDGERPIVNLSRSYAQPFDMLKTGSSASNEHEEKRPKPVAGQPLRNVLNLTDTVFDINNTAITTRPDLFSHLGFARELVALGLASWKTDFELPGSAAAPSNNPTLKMKVDTPKLVPRYLSVMMDIEEMGQTPAWMKKRLSAIGIRSISLPVDITNYVMMEIGVPMHSFDADDIEGEVHLRLSKKNESIVTLDKKEHSLPEGVLVLSDKKGIFDLLGIMGGLRSSTKQSTTSIYLHALSIDPSTIRHAITSTGHRTDAATIYEKQVPPITTEIGFNRAVQLFLELVPGAKLASCVESSGNNGNPEPIELSTDTVRSIIGTDINNQEIINILEKLEFTVVRSNEPRTTSQKEAANAKFEAQNLLITPPLHRLRDIEGSHDIIEEIARMSGLNNIAPQMPTARMQLPQRDMRIHAIRRSLAASGFSELVPLSFVSPSLLKKCFMDQKDLVEVKNPLGEDTSLMQPSTLPALLQHAKRYLPLAEAGLKTFHRGHIFKAEGEQEELSILFCSQEETTITNDPLLLCKKSVSHALHAAGFEVEIEKNDIPQAYMHPGRSAVMTVGGEHIGTIFEVHPTVRSHFDLPHRAAAAIISTEKLLKMKPTIKKATAIPEFPAVSYDETVKTTAKKPIGPILSSMKKASSLLEDVYVHDIYAGKPLLENEYNVTLRFVYRSSEKTLTEEEVKKEHETVMKSW